jgi:hypothetical protein
VFEQLEDLELPGFFLQRCTVQCLAHPRESEHPLVLLAGNLANVIDRVEPFGRPPGYFGVRFRFPPKPQQRESGAGEAQEDFVSVRFETYAKEPSLIWMEVRASYVNPATLSDIDTICANMEITYGFLTNQCVRFLEQFDIKIDDEEQEGDNGGMDESGNGEDGGEGHPPNGDQRDEQD